MDGRLWVTTVGRRDGPVPAIWMVQVVSRDVRSDSTRRGVKGAWTGALQRVAEGELWAEGVYANLCQRLSLAGIISLPLYRVDEYRACHKGLNGMSSARSDIPKSRLGKWAETRAAWTGLRVTSCCGIQ